MTDEMRMMLDNLLKEQQSTRDYTQAVAHNLSIACGSIARVEAQISSLADRLDDLRESHDQTCVDIAQTDKALLRRVIVIEQQAAWVRAWAAGAAAVVVAVFGAVAWVAVRLPVIEGVAKTVGGK